MVLTATLSSAEAFDNSPTTSQHTSSTQIYSSGEWEFVSSNAGVKRYGGAYVGQTVRPFVINEKAYFLLGNATTRGAHATNTALSIDLLTGDINESAALGMNYLLGNATATYQRKIFSIGGVNNAINYTLNNVVEYDPAGDRWRQHSAAPLARSGSIAEQYNGRIYVFGGWGFDTYNRANIKLGADGFFFTELSENPTWRKDVQVYDINTDTWSVTINAPTETEFIDSEIIGNKVYLTAKPSNDDPEHLLSVFDIAESEWHSIELPETLYHQKMTKVGKLLIIYGKTSDSLTINSQWYSYIYDTDELQWSLGKSLPNSDEISTFDIVGSGSSLYYIEFSEDEGDDKSKDVYKLELDVTPTEPLPYEPWLPKEIASETLSNNDKISINRKGNVVNLVLNNSDDYHLIHGSFDGVAQRAALRRATASIYEQLEDSYKFIYFIFNEPTKSQDSNAYGYHVPVQNSISGIGQGIFDFSNSYGSEGKLESIVVLPTLYDLTYGPSLHELAHRWGNYLSYPLESLRHSDWLGYTEQQQYHFGYQSAGGQLGGWNDFDFNLDSGNLYLLSDAPEGTAGFSGLGPGNNSAKYSPLELYLMGLSPPSQVPDIIEPATQPIETESYPIYQIDSFDTISIQQIIDANGTRIPSYDATEPTFDTLFVVVSQEYLTDDEWHSYEHQVSNFARDGNDDYQRLFNFWEATDEKAKLVIPDAKFTFTQYKSDSDDDGLFDYQEEEYGTSINNADSDSDGISDFEEVQVGLDPLDSADADADFDGDGLSNKEEIELGTNIYSEDTDGDGINDANEISLGLDPLNDTDASRAPDIFIQFSDINNDKTKDWLKYRIEDAVAAFSLIDAKQFNIISEFSVSHPFQLASLKVLGDRNADGIEDLGIFGFNQGVERYQLYILDGKTGASLGVWNWSNTLDDVVFKLLPDLTNDGIEEYAIEGTHKINGARQLFIKNGVTKQTHQTFKWVDNWVNTRLVVMSDITSDSVPEIALYGEHKRLNKGQLFVFSGANASEKLTVYNWNKLWSNLRLHKMDDIDSDGTTDWGQFGQRIDDGRYQWVVKKGHDKQGVIRTFSWPADLINVNSIYLSDRTQDGIGEVAIYGKNSVGNTLLRINDGRLPNQRIANFSWPALWHDEHIQEVGDLNNDGLNEVILLGIHERTDTYQLVIKDGATTAEYGRIWLEGDWANIKIHSYDVSNDSHDDIIVNSISKASLERIITTYSGKDLSLLSTHTY
tara:strand:+ start:89 stop:3784 length:3696 start_codon:yes stop_codon:yes gene_type:complete